MSDEIWAVTSYFNPMRWQRRRANYRVFRQQLPFPLVAIELGYDGRFDLAAGDAEILLQTGGGDVMWQKERLLNVALRALPDSCRSVVWMDCDVVFQRTDMPEQIATQLDRAPLVQLFSRVHDLAPDAEVSQWRTRSAVLRHSIPQRIAEGMTPA